MILILWIFLIYLTAGLLFVLSFLIKGISTIDEGAHGSSKGFYIIIVPGVILLWPVLLKKWIKMRKHTIQKPANHEQTAS